MNDGAALRRADLGRHAGRRFPSRRGALYRLDPDGGCELILDGLTISNGLGWSPDGATMYLADSGPRLVHAFDSTSSRARSPKVGYWW